MQYFWRRSRAAIDATIAVWGAAQTGKTAFLAALEPAAVREGMSIFAADARTAGTMRDLRESRSRGRFPEATRVPTRGEELCLLRFGLQSQKTNVEINLTIADAGGSWWIEEGSASEGHSDAFSPYNAILGKCDGLICMLDPTRALKRVRLPGLLPNTGIETPDNVALQTMLAQFHCTRTSNNSSLAPRIAICLAQMDRPEHLSHLGKEEAYFRRLYGVLPLQNCGGSESWSYFGCSAAGVRRRTGYIVSNTFTDLEGQERILDPTAPPLQIFRPLNWLLELGQSWPYVGRGRI